ncbi:MGDG synthase family glycosyltransferase [Chitinolyticbacter meiyuanensis]|uniref:MGDG synthase family glycosyltransferase n=1 Tax=Chitinolyticbacter meiyuanensis TaxID=682798 RepID=UPI0011E6051A|nr:glycosyltransferase [Chitinolyticbacter meiyuanensis]
MSILLLHATAGAGHTRAAQAISAALAQRGDTTHRVVDTLDCTTAFFRKMYTQAYIDLVQKMPALWGYVYERTDAVKPTSKTARNRLAFNKVNSRTFKHLIAEIAPTAIGCSHFLPLELLSDLKARGKLAVPVHAVITDVSPHAFWIYPHIDHYHVATPDGARELVRKGVPAERISVTGIPIDPVFAARTPAPAARAALSLPEQPTVLLLGGGFGVGPTAAMLASFRECAVPLSIVVVAGRNAELKAECERLATELPIKVTVLGFVDYIHQLMDAADLIVTKPGGLTTSEILAKGKPMMLVAPIPGQEQRNCEYLLENGAAVRLYDGADACHHVSRLLANSERLGAMGRNAQRIAYPDAAQAVAAALQAVA